MRPAYPRVLFASSVSLASLTLWGCGSSSAGTTKLPRPLTHSMPSVPSTHSMPASSTPCEIEEVVVTNLGVMSVMPKIAAMKDGYYLTWRAIDEGDECSIGRQRYAKLSADGRLAGRETPRGESLTDHNTVGSGDLIATATLTGMDKWTRTDGWVSLDWRTADRGIIAGSGMIVKGATFVDLSAHGSGIDAFWIDPKGVHIMAATPKSDSHTPFITLDGTDKVPRDASLRIVRTSDGFAAIWGQTHQRFSSTGTPLTGLSRWPAAGPAALTTMGDGTWVAFGALSAAGRTSPLTVRRFDAAGNPLSEATVSGAGWAAMPAFARKGEELALAWRENFGAPHAIRLARFLADGKRVSSDRTMGKPHESAACGANDPISIAATATGYAMVRSAMINGTSEILFSHVCAR